MRAKEHLIELLLYLALTMGFLKNRSSSNKEEPPPPPPPEELVEDAALTDEDSSYGPVPPPPPGTDVVQEKQAVYDLEKQSSSNMAAASTEDEEEEEDDDDIDMPDKNDPPSQDATMPDDFAGADEDDDQSVEIPPTGVVQRMIQTEKDEYEKGSSNSRFCQLGTLVACCLVVLAVVLGAGFGTGAFTKESGNSVAPPEDGTTTTDPNSDGGDTTGDREIPDAEGEMPASRPEDLMLYLASISAVSANLDQDGTAEAAAVEWLTNQDPLRLGTETLSDQFRLSQRFALLSLWFADSEGAWDNSEGWLQAEDECTWFGVTCSEQDIGGETANVVTQVELVDNNLQLQLPADLVLLEYLSTLK